VTDQVTGAAFFLSVRESAGIAIQSRKVPVGLWKKREEPGYLLETGFALLESEKDADGNYIGGAGIDGMYTKTPHRFQPVLDKSSQPRAFRDVTEAYALVAERQGGKRFVAFRGTKARCLRMTEDKTQLEDFLVTMRPKSPVYTTETENTTGVGQLRSRRRSVKAYP
jgi:hypothetical protein